MSDLHMLFETLRTQCEVEVTRFYKEGLRDSPACYTLFQHALENDDPYAFGIIYRTYEGQVKSWVLQHSYYPLTHQPIEHFVSAAYASFYAKLRGQSLVNFPTVANLLGYLKTCVHTGILQYLRSEKKHDLEDELHDSTAEKPIEPTVTVDELWQRMCSLVKNEADQLLMRCAFIEERKPAEIADLYPQHWPNARAVTIALYRIRNALRNDPPLRGMAGRD